MLTLENPKIGSTDCCGSCGHHLIDFRDSHTAPLIPGASYRSFKLKALQPRATSNPDTVRTEEEEEAAATLRVAVDAVSLGRPVWGDLRRTLKVPLRFSS